MTEEQVQQQTSEPTGDASPEQAEVQPDEAATSEDQQATGESPAAEPKKDGIQKRIDEITRARREAEREAEYWRMRAQQIGAPQPPPPQQAAAAEQPPTPQQFQTYDDYVTARAQYEGRQAAMALYTQAEQQRAFQSAQQAAAQRMQSLNEKLITDGAKYPDFDEVVRSESVRITTVMADAMSYTSNAADVAYHLGKNRQEAARIAQLSPVQQAIEIARIGATLAAKPAQKTMTTAPEPPPTIGTRRAAHPPRSIDEMTPQEVAKLSMAEFNKLRGRRP